MGLSFFNVNINVEFYISIIVNKFFGGALAINNQLNIFVREDFNKKTAAYATVFPIKLLFSK